MGCQHCSTWAPGLPPAACVSACALSPREAPLSLSACQILMLCHSPAPGSTPMGTSGTSWSCCTEPSGLDVEPATPTAQDQPPAAPSTAPGQFPGVAGGGNAHPWAPPSLLSKVGLAPRGDSTAWGSLECPGTLPPAPGLMTHLSSYPPEWSTMVPAHCPHSPSSYAAP